MQRASAWAKPICSTFKMQNMINSCQSNSCVGQCSVALRAELYRPAWLAPAWAEVGHGRSHQRNGCIGQVAIGGAHLQTRPVQFYVQYPAILYNIGNMYNI